MIKSYHFKYSSLWMKMSNNRYEMIKLVRYSPVKYSQHSLVKIRIVGHRPAQGHAHRSFLLGTPTMMYNETPWVIGNEVGKGYFHRHLIFQVDGMESFMVEQVLITSFFYRERHWKGTQISYTSFKNVRVKHLKLQFFPNNYQCL